MNLPDPTNEPLATADTAATEPLSAKARLRPNVKRLDFKNIRTAINEVAANRNVPTRSYPTDSRQEGEGEHSAVVAPVVAMPAKPEKVARTPYGKFSVELPLYLIEEIDRQSSRLRTKRYIIMQALKAANFTVHDVDFIPDGRSKRTVHQS